MVYWCFLHILAFKGLIWNFFLFLLQIGKQKSWVIPWEEISRSRCYAMRSCYLLQSLLEELLSHSKPWMKITRSQSSSRIATAKINSPLSVRCRTSVSESSLFGSIPCLYWDLTFERWQWETFCYILQWRFIYVCYLGAILSFLTLWLLRESSVRLFCAFLWHWVPALCQQSWTTVYYV